MIGILDSGIGGLGFARELSARLPAVDLTYFGDTAHAPYGSRSAARIRDWSLAGARYLGEQGACLIVVASHTIACTAGDALRQGLELPLFDPLRPAVESAVRLSQRNRIGLIASRAVLASGCFERLLAEVNPRVELSAAACPLLAALAGEQWLGRPETAMIVKKCVRPIKMRQVDTLILGSGALLPLRAVIARKIGRRVSLVAPWAGLAEQVVQHLTVHAPPSGAGRRRRLRVVMTDLSPRAREIVAALGHHDAELEERG
jgi:glutamate racemase